MLLLIITLQFKVGKEVKKDYWNIHPNNIIIKRQGHLKILLRLSYPQSKEEGEREEEFVPPEEIPLLLLKLIKSTD